MRACGCKCSFAQHATRARAGMIVLCKLLHANKCAGDVARAVSRVMLYARATVERCTPEGQPCLWSPWRSRTASRRR